MSLLLPMVLLMISNFREESFLNPKKHKTPEEAEHLEGEDTSLKLGTAGAQLRRGGGAWHSRPLQRLMVVRLFMRVVAGPQVVVLALLARVERQLF